MKKNKTIHDIVKSVFHWNTYVGNSILIGFICAISAWILWSDQKTGCTATLSIYNQYQNSISREVELDNMPVAIANFMAFKQELSLLGINDTLKINTIARPLQKNQSLCKAGLLSSNINIPLKFAYDIKGHIEGNISYYPSFLALIAIWLVTFFLMITLKRIESGIKHKLENDLINPIKSISVGNDITHNTNYPVEVNDINMNLKFLKQKIVEKQNRENEFERATQLSLLASQVSHDIRSPLSALNLMASELAQISEDKRVIIRSAINRINDISNELLKQSHEIKYAKNADLNDQQNNILLSSLIDSIVSEKRIQYREKQLVSIEANIDQGHGIFININPTELKRAISNLINNSVEALINESGKISVSIEKSEKIARIIIDDDGKGMDEATLKKLGTIGFSSGKNNSESGSGLGIYHAKETIHKANGSFKVKSQLGIGTQISIELNTISPPVWFVEKLIIDNDTTIISLDDDISIHQIWKKRFENFHDISAKQKTFTSGNDFENWVNNQSKNTNSKKLFLIDYELLAQSLTGLDIIEKLGIGPSSVLVTSRFEENAIQERCKNLGVKLMPKSMAGFITIEIAPNQKYMDAILIDDDSLMHSIWSMKADYQNKKFISFYNVHDFLVQSHHFDLKSPLYIDSNLNMDIKGEILAKSLYEAGFKNIYLCTGKPAHSFPPMSWIKEIRGKDPIF